MNDFPADPAEIDAQWLEGRLRTSGAMQRGAVRSVHWELIGTGQMGRNARFHIEYGTEGDGPKTVVAKFPSENEASRALAAAFDVYAKEVRFYQELMPLLDVRAPVHYAAEVDATGSRFVLLLEDLAPARVGNQLAGCSLDDARAAMRQAAAFHAATHNNPAVTDLAWLRIREAGQAKRLQHYGAAQRTFRERYDGLLEPALMTIADRFASVSADWYNRKKCNAGLVHGDFRLDNMLFDIKGGAEPIAVVDWAAVYVDNGALDLGYFLGCGGIAVDLRRAHEVELLELYCEEMSRRGAALLLSDIWDDYRIGALHGLAVAVLSSAFVQRTARGDENFLSMARGAAELARDHDSLGALMRRSSERSTTCP